MVDPHWKIAKMGLLVVFEHLKLNNSFVSIFYIFQEKYQNTTPWKFFSLPGKKFKFYPELLHVLQKLLFFTENFIAVYPLDSRTELNLCALMDFELLTCMFLSGSMQGSVFQFFLKSVHPTLFASDLQIYSGWLVGRSVGRSVGRLVV